MLTVAHAVVSVLFGMFTKQYLFVIGDAPQMMTEHFPAISGGSEHSPRAAVGVIYICSSVGPLAACGVRGTLRRV